ncbi:MAG: EAL domain-containing protein [Amphritea sp.]|nr:EAL domain-containing protein [Amphritea sp.]
MNLLSLLKSPLLRISFGLSMLTVMLLLLTDLLGLMPDPRQAEIESRKVIAESLAVQLSTELGNSGLQGVETILQALVQRNEAVLSAAVRHDIKGVVSEYGNHQRHWQHLPGNGSTTTHIQVPVFSQDGRWGRVELSFVPLEEAARPLLMRRSFLSLLLFIGGVGFVCYWLLLRRALRELDPSGVIPERVQRALDTLAEGVLIIDPRGYIVFSNQVFARFLGVPAKALVGKSSGNFSWYVDAETGETELPWLRLLHGNEIDNGATVKLKIESRKSLLFSVNASAIMGDKEDIRGVLVTFDNMTEIARRNAELSQALDKLERSKQEISRQNTELHFLATHDPLTGILNRRSLFQGFDSLLEVAQASGESLSCIMVDIDHFKAINDRYGHGEGDKVIRTIARLLSQHSRPSDLVGRYGGEEFCLVLPGVDIELCRTIAERIRISVQDAQCTDSHPELRITSSFGIASLQVGLSDSKMLVEQADAALYESKQSGRNRVTSWFEISADSEAELIMAIDPDQTESSALGEDSEPGTENEYAGVIQTSYADSLSSPDSMLLYDRIDQSIRRTERDQTQLAVLVIDIDTLQRAYDTLGLTVGEKIARAITERLKQILRATDTVALTGEDEMLFTILRLESNKMALLLTDIQSSAYVSHILQRIFSALEQPVEVETHDFYLNVNIGVSLYPDDGRDPETLMVNASSAMRAARETQGRNEFRFYSTEINARVTQQLRQEAELFRAMDNVELTLHYQPIIDLKSGEVCSFEALMHWEHPQRGLLHPNDFIPLAEETGVICEMTQWVIRSVCQQLKLWYSAGYGWLTVAINLSPVELKNPQLAEQILNNIEECRVPVSAIEIEITETGVLQSLGTALDILQRLNEAGIKLSLDDFGAGYSSLSYLKQFPLSKVKIDRSFITSVTENSDDVAIVSAINSMSHHLGLTVVAEGVETEAQLRFLQDLRCDQVQGYLFSRPIPRDRVCDFLEQPDYHREQIKEYHQRQLDHGGGNEQDVLGIINDFEWR